MSIDKKEILNVARLARLELTDDEISEFAAQLTNIINYVEKINQLNTDDVKPADHIIDLFNVFRDDVAGESMDTDLIREMSPEFEDGHIVVPRIIEGT